MKRQILIGLAAITIPALLVGEAVRARTSPSGDGGDEHVGHGFSNRTIEGFWGYNSSFGMFLPPYVPERLPFVGMGRIHFDGNGGCSVAALGNLDGQTIASTSTSCTYAVNADGTGTSEAVFPGTPIAGPVPVAFVIVDHGREIRFMNTRFIVATFTARRQ
jgi:hypothetical protein